MKEKTASAASHAIEDFKSLEDFKIEVGEAMYDAYLKGFVEFKAQVSKAFFDLDLQGIIAETEEQEEEEEVKTEVGVEAFDKTSIAKAKEVKVATTMEIMATEGGEELEEFVAEATTKKDKLSVIVEVIKKAGIEEETTGPSPCRKLFPRWWPK